MENKRNNPRLACLVPVDAQKGNCFDLSRTVDLSKGGLGLLSQHKIPLNKEMAIELDLDDQGQSVLVVGQVKWVTKVEGGFYRAGLVFKDVLQGSKSRLTGYLKTIS